MPGGVLRPPEQQIKFWWNLFLSDPLRMSSQGLSVGWRAWTGKATARRLAGAAANRWRVGSSATRATSILQYFTLWSPEGRRSTISYKKPLLLYPACAAVSYLSRPEARGVLAVLNCRDALRSATWRHQSLPAVHICLLVEVRNLKGATRALMVPMD